MSPGAQRMVNSRYTLQFSGGWHYVTPPPGHHACGGSCGASCKFCQFRHFFYPQGSLLFTFVDMFISLTCFVFVRLFLLCMSCLTPYFLGGKLPVPCGKCPQCRVRHASNWAFRIMQEERHARCSRWITLTYDTGGVHVTPNGFMTLVKQHCQEFMKRVRFSEFGSCKSDMKYYLCGEYGTHNHRPHYHCIILNCPERHFFNAWRDEWGCPRGDIYIDPRPISEAAVVYTSLYMAKGKRVPVHKNDDRLREFSLMSKGLGKSYLTDEMIRYHQADLTRSFVTLPGGGRSALPRYYADRIFTEEMKEVQQSLIAGSALRSYKRALAEYVEAFGNSDGFLKANNEARKAAVVNFNVKSKVVNEL